MPIVAAMVGVFYYVIVTHAWNHIVHLTITQFSSDTGVSNVILSHIDRLHDAINIPALGWRPRDEPAISDDAGGYFDVVRVYVARSNAIERYSLL